MSEGFLTVFPDATEGLTEPPKIALVESASINAYALSSIATQGPMGTQ